MMMELSSIGEQALRDFQWILHGFPLIPIVIGFWVIAASNPLRGDANPEVVMDNDVVSRRKNTRENLLT